MNHVTPITLDPQTARQSLNEEIDRNMALFEHKMDRVWLLRRQADDLEQEAREDKEAARALSIILADSD